MALDANNKTFMVYVAIWKSKKCQCIPKDKLRSRLYYSTKFLLRFRQNIPTIIMFFSVDYAAELSENTKINEYAIKLEKDKQPLFGPIYSLRPIELKTLKTYIKTNLANGFIRPFKSPAEALILFKKKPDGSFHLCIDY